MKVLVVDDDTFVSNSLKTILETDKTIQVVALGHHGQEAIAFYEQYAPDILLMDIRMQVMTGLEAAKEILSKHKEAKILFLTTFSDDAYIMEALSIGAKGYILKQDFEGIIPALKAVALGQSVFGGQITDKIPNLIQHNEEMDYKKFNITKKEFEIIEFVAKGFSNKEIAEKIFLSEGTIRNYLSTILEKLELRDRTQLAIFYYQHK